MKGFSKFFTPPFSKDDRDAFFSCLGLSMIDFLFVETSGSLVLRARQFVGCEAEAMLSPTLSLESAGRMIVLRHPSNHLEITPPSRTMSLWEEVFPYPFNLVGEAFSAPNGGRVAIGPDDWRADLHALWSALSALEERMSQTELSCLWVKGIQAEMPVLFHFVRRKRVRVGTDAHLFSLSEKYRAGSLTPDSLKEHFGTQSAFYFLDLQSSPSNLGVAALAKKVEALLLAPTPFPAKTVSSEHPANTAH